MPDLGTWVSSKAELHKGRWRASRDVNQVAHSSRIISDAVIAAYARKLKAHANGVLIDLGCGRAPYLGIYSDLVTKSVGVDWETSPHEGDQVDIRCDLNQSITIPDAWADTVLCTDVLEHIFEPRRTWGEIERVLKPGGKAIIGVPFLYCIHEAPFDYHRYTSFALQKYASTAGLDIEELEVVGGLPYVLADLLCKSVRAKILQPVVEFICRLGIKMFASRQPRTDTSFPIHYVMVVSKKV